MKKPNKSYEPNLGKKKKQETQARMYNFIQENLTCGDGKHDFAF